MFFRKTSVKVLALICCLALLFVAGCAGSQSASSNTVRIGMSAPLTGSQATAGQDMVNGAQMAVDALNAAGGIMGKKVVLVTEDDACDPTQAVNAATKLTTENVNAVMGYYCSGACNACLPVLSRAGLPVVLCAVASTSLTHQGYTNIVRIQGYNGQQGQVQANFIVNTLKAKKVAIIQDGTASPREQATVAAQDAQQIEPGIQILADQITPGEKDFSATATKIKGFNPDAVLFTGFYAEGALLLKQLRAVGVTVPYVAGDGNTDPQFIAVAGADAEGVYMTSPPMTTTIPAAAALIQQYTARFKTSPGAYAAYCWDAVNLIADAMKRANSTTNEPAIITALRASNYQGITGTLSFDKNGDLNHAGYIVLVIKNGQFTNYTGS